MPSCSLQQRRRFRNGILSKFKSPGPDISGNLLGRGLAPCRAGLAWLFIAWLARAYLIAKLFLVRYLVRNLALAR